MKNILDIALSRCEDAELYSVKVEKYPIKFAGNKLKSVKSQLSRGITLRVKKDGKLGFSSSSDDDHGEEFVERAVRSANLGPVCNFEFFKSPEVAHVDLFDPRTVTVEMEEAVEMGEGMIRRLVKEIPGSYSDVHITKYFMEVSYLAKEVEKTYYKTLFSVYVSNMQVMEDGFIYIDQWESSCKVPQTPMHLVDRLVEKIPLTQQVYEMPSRPMTVIFHPKAVGNLTECLEAGLSGTNLVSGSSPVEGKVGQQILSEKFTIIDDPTVNFMEESETFDGEGLPRKKQYLYENGVLKNYLLDLKSSAHLGLPPNGCASRGKDSPPSPRTSNLIIEPGHVPLSDMIGSIKEGLIVEEVIGGGQSNTIAGEFSLNVSLGFKIQDGKMIGRVRNTMIAGNTYNLLKDNLLSLSDTPMTLGGLSTPYIMFKDLSVSGKGG